MSRYNSKQKITRKNYADYVIYNSTANTFLWTLLGRGSSLDLSKKRTEYNRSDLNNALWTNCLGSYGENVSKKDLGRPK